MLEVAEIRWFSVSTGLSKGHSCVCSTVLQINLHLKYILYSSSASKYSAYSDSNFLSILYTPDISFRKTEIIEIFEALRT